MRARLRELAAIRCRYGYRRLLVLMRREGVVMNHKKFRRLYREERLQVRRRGGRKRALGTRTPLANPQGAQTRRLAASAHQAHAIEAFKLSGLADQGYAHVICGRPEPGAAEVEMAARAAKGVVLCGYVN